MLKNKYESVQELMSIRQKNMQKWTEEDFLFYEDFFDEIDCDTEKDILEDDATFVEEAWLIFKKNLKNAYAKD